MKECTLSTKYEEAPETVGSFPFKMTVAKSTPSPLSLPVSEPTYGVSSNHKYLYPSLTVEG